MKLQRASLSLEPRSVGSCIDLAILFYRRHAARLLGLSLLFGALPLVIGALRAGSGDGWMWGALLFFFGSSFLGAAVVAGAGHHVFGEDFTLGNALTHLRRHWGPLLLYLPLARFLLALLGTLCWGILWAPFGARYGFLSEVVVLERLRGRRVGSRLSEILHNAFLDACGRYLAVGGFAASLCLSLFLLFDLGSQLLFGIPILISRLSSAVVFDDVLNLFAYNPLPVTVLAATCWLVYPLARIAWFFCYLDARIRKEGWDVEIAFRVEAERLG